MTELYLTDILFENYATIEFRESLEKTLDNKLSYTKSLKKFQQEATTEYAKDLATILLGDFCGRKLKWNTRISLFYERFNYYASPLQATEASYLIKILSKNKYACKHYKQQIKRIKKHLKPNLIQKFFFILIHHRFHDG